MPRLTEEETKAMNWLRAMAKDVWTSVNYAAVLERMLAQPRLPKQSSPEMLQAMWEAWLSGNPKQPAPWDRVYDALYAELSRPPETDTRWRFEWDYKGNGGGYAEHGSIEEATKALSASLAEPNYTNRRVTGPHKQKVPG